MLQSAKTKRWQAPLVAYSVVLALVGGCASKKVSSSKSGPVEFDKEIPQEIAKSYEVTEKPKEEVLVNGQVKTVAPTVLPTEQAATVATAPAAKATQTKTTQKAAMNKKKQAVETTTGFTIPNRRPSVEPLRQGEKVTFDVTWLKTTAGEISLQVLPLKYIEGRRVYHFRGEARTTSLIASMYKAEDFVESFVDYEGLFPYKFVLHGDESKHIRDNLELYDHAKGKQYVYIKDDRLNGDVREDKGIKDLTPLAQDTLSSLFYLRTLNLAQGKPQKMMVATSGHMSEITITWENTEDVKTKAGRFRARKLRMHVNYKGERKYDDNFFWVTDDDRRLIVKFEVKVRIGWMGGIAKAVEQGAPFEGLSQ